MALTNFNKKQIKEKLIRIRRKKEEESAERIAEKFDLPYLDLMISPINYESINNISRKNAKQGKIIVIQRKNRIINLALTNPNDPKAKEIIEELKKKGFKCKIFVISPTSLNKGLKCYDMIKQYKRQYSLRNIFVIQKKELEEFKESLQTIQKLEETINVLPTSRLLTIIVAGAIEMEASDIHIEPSQKNIKLRYRIDGLLQDIVDFPIKQYAFLLSKIKMLSDILLNVTDISQDGRFSINILENDEKVEKVIDIRVSILPSNQGESVVMRLLGMSNVELEIEKLGVRLDLFNTIKNEISQPNGMILNTGPTGSGKTTTLYACLNYVNKPGKKIITVENPVEYQLKNITQTQISKRRGHTFGRALKAIVRQDPDILMIGEIRDEESAEVAIQFALTGHLVFSTLHTNNAAGAIPRLNGMGINSPSLAAAINLVIAQRLVRKLCPYCKKEYKPTKESLDIIKKIISDIPKKEEIKIPKEITTLYKAEGCSKCHGLGYSGRVGVFELFVVSDAIKKIILERGADYQLEAKAKEEGMVTLMQNAILEIIEGKTTFEEVERVIGSPELSVKKLLEKKEIIEEEKVGEIKEESNIKKKNQKRTLREKEEKKYIKKRKLRKKAEESEIKKKELKRQEALTEQKEKLILENKELKALKIRKKAEEKKKEEEEEKAEKERIEMLTKEKEKERKEEEEKKEIKTKKEQIMKDIMIRNKNRKEKNRIKNSV